MKRFHRPLFALLLSLLLIGSQQAAFAHLLTHLHGKSEAAAPTAHYQVDHGQIDRLADTCTTCIAFAGVGAGAPPFTVTFATSAFAGHSYLLPATKTVFARPVVTRRARAPPLFL